MGFLYQDPTRSIAVAESLPASPTPPTCCCVLWVPTSPSTWRPRSILQRTPPDLAAGSLDGRQGLGERARDNLIDEGAERDPFFQNEQFAAGRGVKIWLMR